MFRSFQLVNLAAIHVLGNVCIYKRKSNLKNINIEMNHLSILLLNHFCVFLVYSCFFRVDYASQFTSVGAGSMLSGHWFPPHVLYT